MNTNSTKHVFINGTLNYSEVLEKLKAVEVDIFFFFNNLI